MTHVISFTKIQDVHNTQIHTVIIISRQNGHKIKSDVSDEHLKQRNDNRQYNDTLDDKIFLAVLFLKLILMSTVTLRSKTLGRYVVFQAYTNKLGHFVLRKMYKNGIVTFTFIFRNQKYEIQVLEIVPSSIQDVLEAVYQVLIILHFQYFKKWELKCSPKTNSYILLTEKTEPFSELPSKRELNEFIWSLVVLSRDPVKECRFLIFKV